MEDRLRRHESSHASKGPPTVVMAYTAHDDYSASDPPTFVVVVEQQDGIAPPDTMQRRVAALRKLGVAVEFHRYPRLGHGFGVGTGTSAEGWISDAVRFWEEHMKKKQRAFARCRRGPTEVSGRKDSQPGHRRSLARV